MRKFLWVVLAIIIAAGFIVWRAGDKTGESLPEKEQTQNETASKEERNLIARATYVCDDGKTVEAAFYEGEAVSVEPGEMPVPAGSAEIVLSDGRSFDLPQTISASGVRYANDDESFIFWEKGGGALILEDGAEKDFTGCVAPTGDEDKNIKVISPNGGEIWQKGEKVEILWEAPEAVESVNIRLAIAGDGEGQSFNAAIASVVANTGAYEWTVQELYAEVLGIRDLPASDKYILIVESAEDNALYDSSDLLFTIE